LGVRSRTRPDRHWAFVPSESAALAYCHQAVNPLSRRKKLRQCATGMRA
jgi:hypothetical protein